MELNQIQIDEPELEKIFAEDEMINTLEERLRGWEKQQEAKKQQYQAMIAEARTQLVELNRVHRAEQRKIRTNISRWSYFAEYRDGGARKIKNLIRRRKTTLRKVALAKAAKQAMRKVNELLKQQ